jgi:NitT/TauT family transport system substrate-binding protein
MILDSYINENQDTLKSFLRALKKAHEFIDNNSEKIVAEAIVKQFPSTTINSIETSLVSYKKINSWNKDLQATEQSFVRLQDIMENAGELQKRVDFNSIVDNSLAKAVFS